VIANFLVPRDPGECMHHSAAALLPSFYNLHPVGQGWLLALVVPLGTWALVVNGTFFAALSVRARNRELLLPLLLFPIFIPALLGMVEGLPRSWWAMPSPGCGSNSWPAMMSSSPQLVFCSLAPCSTPSERAHCEAAP